MLQGYLCPGFDLTIQKWFVKIIAHHGWVATKIFHSRLPKTALNGIFYLFILQENIWFAKKEFYERTD